LVGNSDRGGRVLHDLAYRGYIVILSGFLRVAFVLPRRIGVTGAALIWLLLVDFLLDTPYIYTAVDGNGYSTIDEQSAPCGFSWYGKTVYALVPLANPENRGAANGGMQTV
jgi:hypothetical protein